MAERSVVVVGAGIIGITTALVLHERGWDVTVIDSGKPGMGTSFGNTGVLVDNPWMVINGRGLWRRIPRILAGRDAAARVRLGFVLQNPVLFGRFLGLAATDHAPKAALAILSLLRPSQRQHRRWMQQFGLNDIGRNTGWLKLFRTEAVQDAFAQEAAFIAESDTPHIVLDAAEVREMEPGLRLPTAGGLLLTGAISLRDPLLLTCGYADRLAAGGVAILQGRVRSVRNGSDGIWHIASETGKSLAARHVVIAAGPWSATLLRPLGYQIPMFWERGYHLHFSPPGDGPAIGRAIHDIAGGYVMTPQDRGIRVTSGVEIAHRDAPPDRSMIDAAAQKARALAGLGAVREASPWLGSRPSLIDGLPMIGAAPRHSGLWFNFGHHHIGMSLSAGSALLLGDLMQGAGNTVCDPKPFAPERFS